MLDADTTTIVQNLNVGWRNYICKLLSLDENKFQLAQGCLGLQTSDSSGLFLMENAVPGFSLVGYYDPNTMASRASGYLELLSALLPETNPNALQQALGDMYTNWITYKTTSANWPAGSTLASVYQNWSNQAPIDPGRAARGQAAIQNAQNTPLVLAYTAYNNASNQQSFTDTAGNSYNLYKYTGTNQGATAAISTGGGPYTIDFNSETMDTSSTSTMLSGGVSGFYDIFSAGADGSLDQETAKAAGSSFTVKGTINKQAALTCGPGGWYTAGELSRALNGKGSATIWDPGAASGSWDSFFGQPNGSLARYVSELILVSDYKISVTSTASYSDSEYQKISASASIGIWPFFSAQGSATQTTSVTHNADSSLTMTMNLGQGLIQIWGVIVENQYTS